MKKTTAFVISHESDPLRTTEDQAISIIALTLTRALGRAGVNVVRVHPNCFDDSLSSRYCCDVEICPDLYESDDALTDFLLKMSQRYPGDKVIVPASDDCSLFLARHAALLGSEFMILNPSAATMERVKDKQRQYELARSVGVPIPETYFPEDEAELRRIADRLGDFPYVIKPLEAQKWRLRGYATVAQGNKAIVVNDRAELINEYRRIAAADKKLMVQEIIAGKDEHLYTFLAYCSAAHKPLAHCIRSKLRQAPVDFGYCTATVTCHNDIVADYAKRLLQGANYTGIVGIEFKYDAGADKYKLIEINTRPVNTTGISIGCGVNIPLIAFKDALGMVQEPVGDWQDGVLWLHFSEDLAAALELRRRGRLTLSAWLGSLRGKRVHAIFAADDLRPVWQYYRRYLRRQFGKVGSGRRNRNIVGTQRSWLQRVRSWIF